MKESKNEEFELESEPDLSLTLQRLWMEDGRSKGRFEVTTVQALPGHYGADKPQELSYSTTKFYGSGSFGVVYQATLCDTGEKVAIKKVPQDKRFKNRELQLMQRLDHCNIVKLRHFFYSAGEKTGKLYLNLVMEFLPVTLFKVIKHYKDRKQNVPMSFVKLYLYQMFRGLAYIHSLGICHRDIKPQNLLVDHEAGILKLCDFGSAKLLVQGDPSVSYICSRPYRAPELILGANDYCTKTDVWSAGCVFVEVLVGRVLFQARSGMDQLVEIISVLGTPTATEILEMNPSNFTFPQVKPSLWSVVLRERSPSEAAGLVAQLLKYIPAARISPLRACAHAFFDDLRKATKLPNGRKLPPLFDFTERELCTDPDLNTLLLPANPSSSVTKI